MSDDLVKLALEAGRAAARIEALEKELATCRKYRDAYAEMDKIGTQAVRTLTAERDAAQARADALAEKLEKAVACLEEIKLDCMERAKIDRRGVSTVPISNGTWQTLRATLAQIAKKKE